MARDLKAYKKQAGPKLAQKKMEKPSQPSLIFGTKEAMKKVFIMAVCSGVFLAIVFAMLFSDQTYAAGGSLGALLMGGTLGMIIGQMIWSYPKQQVVVPSIIMMFVGMVLWGVLVSSWSTPGHPLDKADGRNAYLAALGLLFVMGYIGYMFGFWMHVKAVEKQKRFEERQQAHLREAEEQQQNQDEPPPFTG